MSAPIMSRFDLFFILVDDCNEVKWSLLVYCQVKKISSPLNSACKQTGVKNEETKKHTKPGRSPILHDGTSSYAKIVVKN